MSQQLSLFGTDGIRGRVGEFPMTVEGVLAIGKGIGRFLHAGKAPTILVGKDTRLSGDMLEHVLAAGISSEGGRVLLAGVLPTPGVAHAVRSLKADAGVVISASHNPWMDNGIKVFNRNGFKLSMEEEQKLEAVVSGFFSGEPGRKTDPGTIRPCPEAVSGYRGFLADSVSDGFLLKGIRVVLDCANGAASMIAADLFRELGAAVDVLADHPDGRNINDACGSEHPELLSTRVREVRATVGFALDGDGDRVRVCDETGEMLTGDQAVAICARAFRDTGRLVKPVVVTTVMSNMGLRAALRSMDIDHVATRVGDRNVVEAMKSYGAVLGGEDSGHMVFLDRHTTGDGILSALQIVEAMTAINEPLSELKHVMTVFPQVTISVGVRSMPEIDTLPGVAELIHSVRRRLGADGRVLVRYSGTQPICRVMVEGKSLSQVQMFCRDIADAVRAAIG
jgi:phosphoglucosamine mutase